MKRWKYLTRVIPIENIGNIIELSWNNGGSSCIVKIVYISQEKRLLVIKEFGDTVLDLYLKLFSIEENYTKDLMWRYISDNELMAYL